MNERDSAALPSQTAPLEHRAVRASLYSLTNQAIKTLSNFATVLILANYLQRYEFGVFSVALSIQALVALLRDAGLPNALIQRKEVSDLERSSVWWVTTASSVMLALALLLLAGPIASFYEQPKLAPILRIMALPVIIQATGSVQEAHLVKTLRFGRLFIADSGSVVFASLAAIVAVLAGAGVWGLVVRLVAIPVVFGTLCWTLSDWRPSRSFSLAALRSLWVFGGYLFLTTLLSYGISRLDGPFIGKLIGVEAAGVFYMARTLATTPLQEASAAVSRVLFSVFSTVQHNSAAIRTGCLLSTRCLAVVVFPLAAGLVAVTPEAVPVILSPEWIPAIPVIQILATQGLLICLTYPAIQVLYARGRSRLQFAYSTVVALATIASYIFGSRWGIIGVAIGCTATFYIATPFIMSFAGREIGMTLRESLANIALPAVAAVAAGVCVRLLVLISTGPVGWSSGAGLLAAEIITGLGAYFLFARILFPGTLRQIQTAIRAAR